MKKIPTSDVGLGTSNVNAQTNRYATIILNLSMTFSTRVTKLNQCHLFCLKHNYYYFFYFFFFVYKRIYIFYIYMTIGYLTTMCNFQVVIMFPKKKKGF